MPQPRSGNKKSAVGARPGQGNILEHFKPIVQTRQSVAQSRPKTPPSARASFAAASTPLSSPPPSSLPSHGTPTPPPTRPAATEVPASDDDSDDGDCSEDSLEDLSVLLARRQAPQQGRQHSPYATPRAKRTEVRFHSSPLAFMPKHKFDFKTLAKDARLDDAITASSIRAKASIDATESGTMSGQHDAAGHAFVDIVKERSGQDAPKVLRAVHRTQSAQNHRRFCFFDPDYRCPSSTTAPKAATTGPWRLLTQGNIASREQHLASGVLQMAARKMKTLPDSLLDWILDDLCVQASTSIRSGYCSLVAQNPEQIAPLVPPERLRQLFIRLGAQNIPEVKGSELPLSNLEHKPYGDRDWACLQSFLELLGIISVHLSLPALQTAMHALLLMSMDGFLMCHVDLLMAHEAAVQSLAEAVPSPSWDSFCLELSSSLCAGIQSQTIRANALICLPLSSVRVHDLRRRLATVFLFGDAALGRHNPADILAIKDFIKLLSSSDYSINTDTDFAELKSRIMLLDMAIDDGCVVEFDDLEDEKQFNADVDGLASRLGEIWRKINDSGMKLARTETKSVVEWVQQRLSHAVRTRKKAKKSVFDVGSQAEDPFALRQQQECVKRFLRPKSASGEGARGETDGA